MSENLKILRKELYSLVKQLDDVNERRGEFENGELDQIQRVLGRQIRDLKEKINNKEENE